MHACTKCGEVKPDEAFQFLPRKNGSLYRRAQCKDCLNAYRREWATKSRPTVNAQRARYRERHRDRYNAAKRAKYHADPDTRQQQREYRRRWLQTEAGKAAVAEARKRAPWIRMLRTHGLTAERFQAMFADQGGRCPICLRDLPEARLTKDQLRDAPVKMHIDHDHSTGRVRGLLCSTCNQGIGLLREDRANFERAIRYLSP